MGAQIAAHVANAGVPALLLDVTAAAAAEGLTRARSLKPDPFFTPETLINGGRPPSGRKPRPRRKWNPEVHRYHE
jgi:hypothetical protein